MSDKTIFAVCLLSATVIVLSIATALAMVLPTHEELLPVAEAIIRGLN